MYMGWGGGVLQREGGKLYLNEKYHLNVDKETSNL